MANIIKNETGIYKDRLPPKEIKFTITIRRAPAYAWYKWEAIVDDKGADLCSCPVWGEGHTKEEALNVLIEDITGTWGEGE